MTDEKTLLKKGKFYKRIWYIIDVLKNKNTKRQEPLKMLCCNCLNLSKLIEGWSLIS